ncbi:motility associated factor glycosyltransferase family protein [Carboxydothermus pertinax]|uniref:6-hydroxymethylpterin diphosphokinase MptE-like domain-containing protein n=1 Tax=Carboxydothermus pertinax TaxID=870242 RepID=A0A1L8CUG8_9THEO|nr:6-hydroxymethylpterin diphosphokinase MptE-like protein [Carboxydothermus pertinax]GAV22541.1 hypothetical protein cpu_10510 [Carboxydothermus pertinax]
MNSFTKLVKKKLVEETRANDTVIMGKSKDCFDLVKIRINNKENYIGSKYNHLRDIELLLEKVKEEKSYIYFIFGLGAGEYIEPLLEKLDEKSKLIIVEPNKNIILNYFLLNKKEVNDERLIIIDFDKNLFTNVFYSYVKDENQNDVIYSVYANYDYLFYVEYKDFLEMLRDCIRNLAINHNTYLIFSETWYYTYFKNFKSAIKSKPINLLKGIFKGKPAIVVSAGPSLEKNVHLLKNISDNFIIITGGRTLKTLLDLGVEPDFVCVVDAGEPSYLVIKDALKYQFSSYLLFTEITNAKVVEEFPGEKVFFSVEQSTKHLLDYKVDSLYTGGSVAHTCVDFAVYLGCDNVILIGQDLAYTEDKHHAELATFNEVDKVKNINSEYILVNGLNGDKVKTTSVLDEFRKKFEGYFEMHKHIKFINATEGGAFINGAEAMTLKEAITLYGKEKIDKTKISKVLSGFEFDLELIMNNIKELAELATRIIEKINDAKLTLERLRKKVRKGKNIGEELKKLDEVDLYLQDKLNKYEFINYLAYPYVYAFIVDMGYEIGDNDDEVSMVKKIYKKNKELYNLLLDLFTKTRGMLIDIFEK